jgi:hypothetical protein
MDSPQHSEASSQMDVTQQHQTNQCGEVDASAEDTRVQPWKQILDDAPSTSEASGTGTDFFACSNGFYMQSLAG